MKLSDKIRANMIALNKSFRLRGLISKEAEEFYNQEFLISKSPSAPAVGEGVKDD